LALLLWQLIKNGTEKFPYHGSLEWLRQNPKENQLDIKRFHLKDNHILHVPALLHAKKILKMRAVHMFEGKQS